MAAVRNVSAPSSRPAPLQRPGVYGFGFAVGAAVGAASGAAALGRAIGGRTANGGLADGTCAVGEVALGSIAGLRELSSRAASEAQKLVPY